MKKLLIAGVLLLAILSMAIVGFTFPSRANEATVTAEVENNAPQRMGRGCGVKGMSPMQALIDLTGLSYDEIRELRLEGKSILEIAQANGIEIEAIKATIIEQRSEVLQDMVEQGTISQELADQRLETMKSMVENMLERTDNCPQGDFNWENMKQRMSGKMNGKRCGGEMGTGMKANFQ